MVEERTRAQGSPMCMESAAADQGGDGRFLQELAHRRLWKMTRAVAATWERESASADELCRAAKLASE